MSSVVVAIAYGGPEVLTVIDGAAPEPGPGEARIGVRAAGVNPIDYKSFSGAFGTDPARLPLRLGAEAAGVVTAVGAGAAGPAGPVAVGDEVIAYPAPGAYAAEQARLELTRLVELGRLRVVMSQTFPLADAAGALRASMGGHAAGKIVLVP